MMQNALLFGSRLINVGKLNVNYKYGRPCLIKKGGYKATAVPQLGINEKA
jgi:hypothetical protein